MHDISPENYLRTKGIKIYGPAGPNNVKIACPVCGESEGGSFNILTGNWKCHRASCGAQGGYHQFKVHFGDAYEIGKARPDLEPCPEPKYIKQTSEGVFYWREQLVESDSASWARQYLIERGFHASTGAAAVASLGWRDVMPGEPRGKRVTGWLTIPYFHHRERTPWMVKVRKVPPEPVSSKTGKPIRYWRLKGGTTTIYAPLGLNGKTVLLVGGELDALSIIQALLKSGMQVEDIPWDIVAPPSESSISCVANALDSCEDIVVVYDNDRGGTQGTKSVIDALGAWKCRIGNWPEDVNDANDALKNGLLKPEVIEKMVNESRAPKQSGFVFFSDMGDRLIGYLTKEGANGYPTGIRNIDNLMGGLRGGEVTGLTAWTGSGKTTLTSQIALHFAQNKHRAMICPFEVGATVNSNLLAWQLLGEDPTGIAINDPAMLKRRMEELQRYLILFDHYGKISIDAFLDTVKFAIHRMNVRLLIIDHKSFMVDAGSEDRWYKENEVILRSVEVVRDTHAHMLVVAHPTEGKNQNTWSKPPTMGDIKGHSDFIQACQNVGAIHRRRNNQGDDIMHGNYACSRFHLWKHRNPKGKTGWVDLLFNPKTNRFH